MKIKKRLPVLSGILIGYISYSFAINKLINYSEVSNIVYTKLDFFNLALLTTDFNHYEYLSRKDYTLGFLPFIFLFFGTFISSSSFLMKAKGYHSFVIARVNHNAIANLAIRGRIGKKILQFVSSFMVILYLLAFFMLPIEFNHPMPISERKLIIVLFLHAGVKVLILYFLTQLTFLFYYIKDTAFAFLNGVLGIIILYLIDLQWEGVNVLLFYSGNYFLDSLVLLTACNFIIYRYSIYSLKLDYLK